MCVVGAAGGELPAGRHEAVMACMPVAAQAVSQVSLLRLLAHAFVDVEQQHPGTELSKLPLRAIRERLETAPATAPKVAALLAQRAGDPTLVYGSIKLVLAALQQGVSFALLSSRSAQPPF